MKNAGKAVRVIFRPEYLLFWILAVSMAFFRIVVGGYFFDIGNLMNILAQASYMMIMVMGVTWVIGANEMDASFPDAAACASMVFAYSFHMGLPLELSILFALASGVVLGLVTSFLVIKFKFHSLITTIAVSTIAKSIAACFYGGMPLPTPGIKSSWMYKFLNANVGRVPIVFLIAVALYAICFVLQEKTRYGQYIYALRENRQAVKEAGIRESTILLSIFVTSAVFAALGGLVMVFTVYNSGQPSMGSSFFLDGFTTVFLGAMAIKLGKTNVIGTFLGALMLAILVNGLTMMGVGFAVGQIVKGALLVTGVVAVSLSHKQIKGKIGRFRYE